MIVHSEIIQQPLSGEYKEEIYDVQSPWNSPHWTWIKFANDDGYEWTGSFRGEPINVALSEKHQIILVLTSNYLFQLDIASAELIKYDDHRSYYQGLTISPLQDFIMCDYSCIYKIEGDIDKKTELKIPQSVSIVDYLKLKKWDGNKLQFTCENPTSQDHYLCDIEYDCITNEITLLKESIL